MQRSKSRRGKAPALGSSSRVGTVSVGNRIIGRRRVSNEPAFHRPRLKTTSVKKVIGFGAKQKALKSSGDERVEMNEAPLLDGGAWVDVMVIRKRGYAGGAARKGRALTRIVRLGSVRRLNASAYAQATTQGSNCHQNPATGSTLHTPNPRMSQSYGHFEAVRWITSRTRGMEPGTSVTRD